MVWWLVFRCVVILFSSRIGVLFVKVWVLVRISDSSSVFCFLVEDSVVGMFCGF